MKDYHQLEVILFSRYSLKNLNQKDLLKWLRTTAQFAIDRQNDRAKKLLLKTLTDSPAIYFS